MTSSPTPRRTPRLLLALALPLALVACSDDDADDAGSTTTSSPVTSTTIADGDLRTIDVDGRPAAALGWGEEGVLVASDGEASGAGVLRHYRDASGEVAEEVEVGTDPVALVGIGDAAWTIGATGLLSKVDPEAGTVLAEVDLGGALTDAVIAGGRLLVADIGRSLVHVLDPENGEVAADPIVVDAGAVRLTGDGARVWVSGLEDQVTPIDVEALVARAPVTVGRGPIGMAIADDVLWVANSDDDTVTRISLESGQQVGAPLAVGDAPIAVLVSGADVWVLNQDDRSVHRLDAETGEPIGGPIELPTRPRGMSLGTAGLWVVGVDPSQAVLVPRH